MPKDHRDHTKNRRKHQQYLDRKERKDPNIDERIKNAMSFGKLDLSSNSGKFIAFILLCNVIITASKPIKENNNQRKLGYDDTGKFVKKSFLKQVKSAIDPNMPSSDREMVMDAVRKMTRSGQKSLSVCLARLESNNPENSLIYSVQDIDRLAKFSMEASFPGKILTNDFLKKYPIKGKILFKPDIIKHRRKDPEISLAGTMTHESMHCNQQVGIDHGNHVIDANNFQDNTRKYLLSLHNAQETQECVDEYNKFVKRLEKIHKNVLKGKKIDYLQNLGTQIVKSWKNVRYLMQQIVTPELVESIAYHVQSSFQDLTPLTKSEILQDMGAFLVEFLHEKHFSQVRNHKDMEICTESLAYCSEIPSNVMQALDPKMYKYVNTIHNAILEESYQNLDKKSKKKVNKIYPPDKTKSKKPKSKVKTNSHQKMKEKSTHNEL